MISYGVVAHNEFAAPSKAGCLIYERLGEHLVTITAELAGLAHARCAKSNGSHRSPWLAKLIEEGNADLTHRRPV